MAEDNLLTSLILTSSVKEPEGGKHTGYYRDRLKNTRTWLALGENDLEVLEAVVSETVALALPAALGLDTMELVISNNILTYLVNRDELTEDQICRLLRAYVVEQGHANNTSWEFGLGPNWKRHEVESELSTLLQRPACTVPLIGTAWRSLHAYTDTVPATGASYRVDACVIANPNTPAVVSARLLTAYRPSDGALTAPAWKMQVARDFPDLVGIPHRMLVDAVASQPIPDEWFQDVFPVPAGVKLSAPGVEVVQ